MDIFLLFISAIFVNNIVLAQYLGNCPYLGCSKEKGVSIGMGAAVVFVTFMATLFTYLIQKNVLIPFNLGYLQTIVFILVIAALVQFVEMFLKKMVPPLYKSLGIFLPLMEFDFVTSLIYAVAAGAGFMLALVVLAGIRERFEITRIPRAMRGVPIGLVMAGIMSLAFMAFKGMI
jgi:electron transport complex protein RnfA